MRTLSILVTIGIGFFMMPFLIHSLGDEQYSLWAIIGTILGSYALLDIGIGQAINRFFARSLHIDDPQAVNSSLSTSVVIFSAIGALSLLVTMMAIFIGPHFIANKSLAQTFQVLILILGVRTALTFPLFCFQSFINAKNRFDLTSLLGISTVIARSAVIVIIVSEGHGLTALALGVALVELPFLIVGAVIAYRIHPGLSISVKSFRPSLAKEYFHFGKYGFISSLAINIKESADSYIIAGVIALSAISHFTVAGTLIFYFESFMFNIFSVVAPSFNEYHQKNDMKSLAEKFLVVTELATYASLLMAGGLILFGDKFITLWMGPAYLDAYLPLAILAVAACLASSQRTTAPLLVAMAKHKYYAGIMVAEAMIKLASSIVLAIQFGLIGVAVGTLASVVITKIFIQPRVVCAQLEISLSEYYRVLARRFTMAIVFFITLYLLKIADQADTYANLIALSAVTALLYILLVFMFTLSRESKRLVMSIIGR